MRAYTGEKAEEGDIPAELASQADQAREKLIEAAAETDDSLITKYLEGEELTAEELANGVRAGIAAGTIIPILIGSATKVIGARRLLDSIASLFPSPADRLLTIDGKEIISDPAKPLTALIFKTTADPYVGRLSYFRVLAGTLKSDSHVWNANRNSDERIGTVYHIVGKSQEHVSQIGAGDIGAVAKPADTHTGDTLCARESAVTLEPISFPHPSFSAAISPKTKADLDKMGTALHRIAEEDPSLRLDRSPDTGEMILSGLGIPTSRSPSRRSAGSSASSSNAHARVPYKETVKASAQAEYTHKKQTGGHGQFARVALEAETLPRGTGFEFVNKTVGGVVPKQYIGSSRRASQRRSATDPRPLPDVDMRVTLYDGKEHPVDSSDIAFKLAAAQAMKKGAQDAQPIILEPIMDMQITVPEANTGDVISDLNGKRARVLGMTPSGTMTTVDAQDLRRSAALRRRYAIAQGRGFFSMSLSHFEEVPAHLAQKIVDNAIKEREAARA